MFAFKPEEPMVMIQSADPERYFDMLRITSRPNREYCLRHGIRYASVSAVLRGFYPWHACFNRILFLNQLLDLGYEGWFLHIDADAYVHDREFDLGAYLSARTQHSLILASGGSDVYWNVNDGIFFANCGHPTMREIARRWQAALDTYTPERLRGAPNFDDIPCDQALLQWVLRENPSLADEMLIESHKFINSPVASFARQVLRVAESTFAQRVRRIALDVESSLAAGGAAPESVDVLAPGLARALGVPLPGRADLDMAADDPVHLANLLRLCTEQFDAAAAGQSSSRLTPQVLRLLSAISQSLGIPRPDGGNLDAEASPQNADPEVLALLALITKRKKSANVARAAGVPIAEPDRHIAALRALVSARRDTLVEARHARSVPAAS
ncbi:hypothetical protein [Roseomonas populi]|uniref:Uncharacterized protein n=1 Tax=Roseomonas populi TaxID=3121582 RepID=A0ABT1XAX7_9PROT|nr:hypothetical protein [Roseomonas pecuniae]MCR0985271.1 hypothetical protein [Roseomonas pecuniae]